jgi:hypothetical protein
MGFFYVDISGGSTENGIKTMLIEADTLAIAKALADIQFDGDSNWDDGAEVTTAAADLEGWSYRVRVGKDLVDNPLGGLPDVDVEYVGVASDTADLVGAELKDLLAAHESELCEGADYDTGSNVLTIAETTDGIGDRTIEVIITPPGAKGPLDAMRTTLVHQGSAGDALSCVLVQPTAVPSVLKEI